MRLLHDEHHGTKACNDADSCPTLRTGVRRIYLPAPLDAQAWPQMQTRLPSRLQPHFMGRTGCEFWKSLEPFEVKGESRYPCDLAIRRMRATHHDAQAHAWPPWCHDLPRVFLTAPPASAPGAFPLRPCEQPLRGGKLATSSMCSQGVSLAFTPTWSTSSWRRRLCASG